MKILDIIKLCVPFKIGDKVIVKGYGFDGFGGLIYENQVGTIIESKDKINIFFRNHEHNCIIVIKTKERGNLQFPDDVIRKL